MIFWLILSLSFSTDFFFTNTNTNKSEKKLINQRNVPNGREAIAINNLNIN